MSNETPIDRSPRKPGESWRDYFRRTGCYKSRDGRTWYRKSDPPPPQSRYGDVLIGLQAIAIYLNLSTTTISKYIKLYNLPAYLSGDGRYRCHISNLDLWAKSLGDVLAEHDSKQNRNQQNPLDFGEK